MPILHLLRRNTFTLIVSNAGSALLSFVLAALIGRALGEDGLGVYTAALAWVFPLSLIVEFGIGTLITRDLAAQPQLTQRYLRLALWERVIFGGVILLILFVSAPLLSASDAVSRGLIIAAPLVLINPLYGTFTALFRARQIMMPIAVMNLAMLVAQVVFTAWVFATGGDVLDALMINTLTSAGQMIVSGVWWAYFSSKYDPTNTATGAQTIAPLQNITPAVDSRGDLLGRPTSSADPRINIYDILRRAYPFAIAAVLAALTTRIGYILLEQLTNTGEVGYFAAANRVIEGVKMLPNAFFGALFPLLASLSTDQPALNRTFRQITVGLAGFGGLVTLICTPLAGTIIMVIYGDAFTAAEGVLIVLAWGFVPAILRSGQTLYWYARGGERRVNMVTFGGLLVQIVLSLWLIPLHGASGLAWVMLITESGMLLALLTGKNT